MIKSTCHSDDYAVEVEFDATPWFLTASDQKIIALMNCEFGGDYGADAVAEDLADQNTEIEKMFTYISIVQKKRSMGFECHVDACQALNWISKNRPNIDVSEAVIEQSLFRCTTCKKVCDPDSKKQSRKSDSGCPDCG